MIKYTQVITILSGAIFNSSVVFADHKIIISIKNTYKDFYIVKVHNLILHSFDTLLLQKFFKAFKHNFAHYSFDLRRIKISRTTFHF